MFRQSQDVVRGVVIGIVFDYKLPRQSKIEVEAYPPEKQKQEVQAAKSQIAGDRFFLRSQRKRRQGWDEGKKKESISRYWIEGGSPEHDVVVEPDELR